MVCVYIVFFVDRTYYYTVSRVHEGIKGRGDRNSFYWVVRSGNRGDPHPWHPAAPWTPLIHSLWHRNTPVTMHCQTMHYAGVLHSP